MRGRLAIGAGGLCAVHALPALAGVGPIRRRVLPRLSGLGRSGHVALTFDDGPHRSSTPAFLRALDDLGWKATFFMLGEMVRADPGLAADVAAAGHEVAVHGDRHRSELLQSPRTVADELRRAVDSVSSAVGTRPTWFRPPYGTLSAGGVMAARQLRLRTVLWSTWGRDWRSTATPATVVAEVRRHLGPGATVLLHDSDCSSAPGSWRSALGALGLLAEVFAESGLEIGPLADHGMRLGSPEAEGR